MKWLKNMSTKELREAYEKVTNEEDLQEFENHCQNVGIRIHNGVKEEKEIYGIETPDMIWNSLINNVEFREAVKALVNHSLKMMDK